MLTAVASRRNRNVVSAVLAALTTCTLLLQARPAAAETLMPRTVLAVYDKKLERAARLSLIHRFMELPLNHLGLRLEFHDVHGPLPDTSRRSDVRGILACLTAETRLNQPASYLAWLELAIDSGKPVAILCAPGFYEDGQGRRVPLSRINRLWKRLGLSDTGGWIHPPLAPAAAVKDAALLDFEHPTQLDLPGFRRFTIVRGVPVSSHLKLRIGEGGDADLIATGPRGAMVVEGAAIYSLTDPLLPASWHQWRLNPFEFFRRVFRTDDLPKADVTSCGGKRLVSVYFTSDRCRFSSMADAQGSLDSWCRTLKEIMEAFPEFEIEALRGYADLTESCFDQYVPSITGLYPLGYILPDRYMSLFDQFIPHLPGRYRGTAPGSLTLAKCSYAGLQATFERSNAPLRLTPLLIPIPAEGPGGVVEAAAAESLLKYARQQDLCVASLTRYRVMAESFYETEFVRLGPNRWKIKNYRALPAVRFDRASQVEVDMPASKGILSSTRLHGSLYVFLSGSLDEAIVTLREVAPA